MSSIFMKTMAAKNPIAALRKEGEMVEASASASAPACARS